MGKFKISGIYTITNLINGKIYVGYSSDLFQRKREHKRDFKYKKHGNDYIQKAVNKHGIDNFKFEILEECDKEFLCSQENYWCNMLNTHNREFGYNIAPTSPNCRCGHSEYTKLKLSVSKKGVKLSEEHRKRIGLGGSKPIFQYDLNGNFIKEWISAIDAARTLNIHAPNISIVLNKNKRSCGGFMWKNYKLII